MSERIDRNHILESSTLPESVEEAFDWLEKEITKIMEGEDRPEDYFRMIITQSQIGDVMKYITHDPKLNPGARLHGTREDEILAYGQAIVQTMGLMVSRGISFKKALAIGLENWQERDWRKKEARNNTTLVEGKVANIGKTSGIAYVVSNEHRIEKFEQGILVTPFVKADDMVDFFKNAPLAIVTDHGGVVSHPAILARELEIPAIVGTGNATEKIPHGSKVSVDAEGEKGTVTVIVPR